MIGRERTGEREREREAAMDELAHMLSGMAPGQIEQAVQLLQRYTAANRQGVTEEGKEAPPQENNDNNGGVVSAVAVNNRSSHASVECDSVNSFTGAGSTVGSVIALALRQAMQGAPATTADSPVKGDDDDDDDVPLIMLLQKRRRSTGKRNSEAAMKRRKLQEAAVDGKEKNNHFEQQQQQPGEEGRVSSNKCKSSPKAANSPEQPTTATAARGLASFGFVSTAKKPAPAAGEKNKLFTPFVQDRRVVPHALQFWCHEGASTRPLAPPPSPPLSSSLPRAQDVVAEPHSVVVDENSSSLMHSPVLYCDDDKKEEYQCEKKPCRYASFAALIDAASTNMISNSPNLSAQQQQQGEAKQPQCPCTFHVSLVAPRAGFKNEVVFCGFYAIGYDPCQSRPPYFGTYNNQDSLNKEELLRLARFGVGSEMPRMSNLDYEYDSADDWDVVEGDEDLGASSSDTEDEEDSSVSSLSESDNDFINDDNDEDEDDSDADLQRKMVEERQRRVNRLRQKDKLVPAFSGPFVGIATVEHPLREYDHLERLGSALDGATFTTLMEQEMRVANAAVSCASATITGGGGGEEYDNLTMETLDEKMTQQRLVAAALRNRREMLPEELDAVHAIIAANGKISPRAIVETLLEQQLCVGVARAEILRTIRRYYDRRHNTMVRRDEPWSPTDERLFTRPMRQKTVGNSNNDKTEAGKGCEEDEKVEDDDDDEDDDMTLVELALKRSRAESKGVEGEC